MRADINGFSLCPECKGKVIMDPDSAEKCVVCHGDGVLFERKKIPDDLGPSTSGTLLTAPCCRYARVGLLAQMAHKLAQFVSAQRQREEARQAFEAANAYLIQNFPDS